MTGRSSRPRSIRRIVWSLALGQVVVWAAMYYSFPAMLLVWETELGWTKTELSGAFTLALVMAGTLAPGVGRLIDRGFGQSVFLGSALSGALALIGLSRISELWQFYLVWLLIGVAMAGCLYEPCFAVLTRALGTQAKRAITLVTLIAGFAGTVSFPTCHALVGLYGWRATEALLGVGVIVIAMPLIWMGCHETKLGEEHERPLPSTRARELLDTLRRPVFWFIALGFAAMALNHGILITHLLPLLSERRVHPDVAVFAASMIGPMQVAGRLAMMAAEHYVSMMVIALGSFVMVCVAAMSLFASGWAPMLLVVFVILQGAGYGVTSITRPVVTASILGHRNFGSISGLIAVPYQLSTAAAPIVAALVWGFGGYDNVIVLAIVAALIGMGCLTMAAVAARRSS